jgi:two-component system, chemotaxis family, chemotaxis protein CheY
MGLTVMVVDDEADVRLIARLVLGAAEFDVLEVGSAASALAELEAGRTPDVILLDVRMPDLDGWGMLRRLRANPDLAHLPVVMFTADMSARSEAPAELREGDVLITKPFQADDLLHAVQVAVGRS